MVPDGFMDVLAGLMNAAESVLVLIMTGFGDDMI